MVIKTDYVETGNQRKSYAYDMAKWKLIARQNDTWLSQRVKLYKKNDPPNCAYIYTNNYFPTEHPGFKVLWKWGVDDPAALLNDDASHLVYGPLHTFRLFLAFWPFSFYLSQTWPLTASTGELILMSQPDHFIALLQLASHQSPMFWKSSFADLLDKAEKELRWSWVSIFQTSWKCMMEQVKDREEYGMPPPDLSVSQRPFLENVTMDSWNVKKLYIHGCSRLS